MIFGEKHWFTFKTFIHRHIFHKNQHFSTHVLEKNCKKPIIYFLQLFYSLQTEFKFICILANKMYLYLDMFEAHIPKTWVLSKQIDDNFYLLLVLLNDIIFSVSVWSSRNFAHPIIQHHRKRADDLRSNAEKQPLWDGYERLRNK